MTNIIIAFNLIACGINIITIILAAFAVKKRNLYWQSGVFLFVTLLITFFVFFANVMEYTGIYAALDSYEEYFELLIIPAMSIFFYSQTSEDELRIRKQNERQLKKLLDERKVIIHELHHRIRNNIQVIYSLLNLQVENCEQAAIRAELATAANRIEAVGTANYYLYIADDSNGMNLEFCITDLIGNLFSSFILNRDLVDVNVSDTGISRGIDTVVPCCLIINEIVSNIFRVLKDRTEPSVLSIEVNDLDGDEFELTVRYEGIKLSDEAVFNGSGISSRIIEELVVQLNGSKETRSSSEWKTVFKLHSI